MARIKLSPLLSEVSGSIGSFTFQRCIGGQALRLKPLLKDYRTENQLSQQALISSLINQWHSFSDAQRLLWQQYASYSRHVMRNNRKLALSGYQLFLKYNLLRLTIGMSIFTSPQFYSLEMIDLAVICESPGKAFFVAAGQGGNTLAYSYDGINWTGLGTSIFSVQGRGCCWNNEKFVAAGQGTNSLAYSADGINWTGLGTSIFTNYGLDVCWSGSMFVAAGWGTNSLAYSANGINWTGLGTSIFSTQGYDVCWSGNMFVAVGDGTNTIAYSYDGINWTGLGTSIFTSKGLGVCYNGDMFVATGEGGNTLAYSYDGINWTGLGTSTFDILCDDVCWNGNMFVAVGAATNTIAYSYDGINWTGLGYSIFSASGVAICWNGNMFVAVGHSTNSLAYSYDGINWTGLGTSTFSLFGLGICQMNAPRMYPVVYPPLYFNFGEDLYSNNQVALLKLSRPCRPTAYFQSSKCRVINFDYTDTAPYEIMSLYYDTFGVVPDVGESLMCEFQVFLFNNAKVYPRYHSIITIESDA